MQLTEFTTILTAAARQNNISDLITDQASEHLFSFCRILIAENEKYNLTAIKQPSEVIYKHIIDSLLLSEHLPNSAKMIDVGCGAGFPSLPLAIVRPDLDITCLDSTAKKINFTKLCVDSLSLNNVTAICGRAEEIGHAPAHRDKYDIATARAVANLPVLCELCLPLVKPNGHFLAMKGRFSQHEFNIMPAALSKLSAENLNCRSYQLITPEGSEERTLVSVTKIGKTNNNFPRKYAVITKNPLR